MTYALWIVEGMLALLFLCTGGMKLVLPLAQRTGPIPLPGWFVRGIGVAEVLGAIGLILPRLLRIRAGLTPLAAAGLVRIMIGATVLNVVGGDVASALIALVVGRLTVFVAYGCWRRTRQEAARSRKAEGRGCRDVVWAFSHQWTVSVKTLRARRPCILIEFLVAADTQVLEDVISAIVAYETAAQHRVRRPATRGHHNGSSAFPHPATTPAPVRPPTREPPHR